MIDERRFNLATDRLTERHDYEFEIVHNGSGRSEEMPSQLERRHDKERNDLEMQRRTLGIMQWLKIHPYTR